MADVLTLPSLPREALKRIETAEREARKRYDQDKWPYFPINPEFSFLEESIINAKTRILEYVRLFAEDVLDAHLKEYLAYAPRDLLTNQMLLGSLCDRAHSLAVELWDGYNRILFGEPVSRETRFFSALAERKPLQSRLGVPDAQMWADLWYKWSEEDSAMSRLTKRFDLTLGRALPEKVRTYRAEAARLLGVEIPSGNSTDDAEAGVTSAGETSTEKPQRPRSGRGRPPIKPAHQRKLVEIMDPHGGPSALIDGDVLEQVCEELDNAAVPYPTTWPNNDPPARSWTRQRQNDPEIAHKAIAERYRRFKQAQN